MTSGPILLLERDQQTNAALNEVFRFGGGIRWEIKIILWTSNFSKDSSKNFRITCEFIYIK